MELGSRTIISAKLADRQKVTLEGTTFRCLWPSSVPEHHFPGVQCAFDGTYLETKLFPSPIESIKRKGERLQKPVQGALARNRICNTFTAVIAALRQFIHSPFAHAVILMKKAFERSSQATTP